MNMLDKVKEWKGRVDGELLEELNSLKGEQIENAFYKDLAFGTGGLRGEIGVGTNCMNVFTVRKATMGIANYLLSHGGKKVAISRDSRNKSEDFAFAVAEVFASKGIKVYITKELMPTPFLSYITRELKCDMGVMITASHNPAKYNGYKVYGSDGCQLTDKAADEVTSEIEKVDIFSIATESKEKYLQNKMIEIVSDKYEENFLQAVLKQNINNAKGLKVTYTPLNGTGYRLVPKILSMIGIDDINIVTEQGHPDGNFPTCSYPNPEKKEALKQGLECAKKANSDILLATDPDADRVGIAVKHDGEYALLTGNEVGILLTEYLLSGRKIKSGIIIKTIVSSLLGGKVAVKHGAEVISVLTGFKYIGEKIGELEKNSEEKRFVLGFEESYGYLAGTHVRDKDAVVACMLIAEMTEHYLREGKTLVDKINEIYDEFGYYQNRLVSYQFDGASGNAKMQELIGKVRNDMPKNIAGFDVIKSVDYLTQTELDLPKANVLQFDLSGGNQLIIRPSGTEPLVKMYLTATIDRAENEKIFSALIGYLDGIFAVKK